MPDGGPMLARVTASPVATELLAGMFEMRWALTRLEHDMVVDNPALRE